MQSALPRSVLFDRRAAGTICSQCIFVRTARQSRRFQCRQKSSNITHMGQRFAEESPGRDRALAHDGPPVLEVLERRGLINQIAGDRSLLNKLLHDRRMRFYSGIDPTASSLHLGHLLPFMVLFWMYRYGHHVVSLVGEGTVSVGDPTGRLTSRQTMSEDQSSRNVKAIDKMVRDLWKSSIAYGDRRKKVSSEGTQEMLNNAEWLKNLTLMDFLRNLGTGVRVGPMLGRDTVKNKLEKGDGMSFAELTYPLLQAWDWWHMWLQKDVQIQVGGSDQYGNIISGIDAIKHIASHHAQGKAKILDKDGKEDQSNGPFGITTPLLTTSSGEKFGKSAGNAIWLDPTMTSPFDLYGHLLRTSDADVGRFLKLLTVVPLDEIDAVMIAHVASPEKRGPQHLLASEVLELVHGRDVAMRTKSEHAKMRTPTLASLGLNATFKTESTNADSTKETPKDDGTSSKRVFLAESLVLKKPLSRVLFYAGLAPSKSAAAKMVANGGVYVGTNLPASDATDALDISSHAQSENKSETELSLQFVPTGDAKPEDTAKLVLDGKLLILRAGKWKIRVIELVTDEKYAELVAGGDVVPPSEWKGRL